MFSLREHDPNKQEREKPLLVRTVASDQGEVRNTVQVFSPSDSLRTSCTLHPVKFPSEFDVASLNVASYGVHKILFRASDEDELSIAASEGGFMPSDMEDSAGLPPSGVVAQSECDAELAAMLARAATGIRREWNSPPCHNCGPRMPSLANLAEMREFDKMRFLNRLSHGVASSATLTFPSCFWR